MIPQANAQNIPIGDLRRYQGITITGTVQSIVGNEFLLRDNTGEIIVDAGPRWYHQIHLSPGERVTVVGEYDDDDFDAFRITRESGEVIVIRNGPGRPPWAGGRGRR
ncbi:MAG: NirD/YgiW/YdeI family stress tolerance protein [Cyanobacteriota bacterium]